MHSQLDRKEEDEEEKKNNCPLVVVPGLYCVSVSLQHHYIVLSVVFVVIVGRWTMKPNVSVMNESPLHYFFLLKKLGALTEVFA